MHSIALRYLDHVGRHGSIRKAAAALNIASSAVNRQILKLEHEIGTPLFERIGHGVRPTIAGEMLLRHARETLSEFDRACSDIGALTGDLQGEVRIIALSSVLARFVPMVVSPLARRFPRVTMRVLEADPGEMTQEIEASRHDIGIVFADRRYKNVTVMAEHPTAIGAIMRPDHPLARKAQLTLTECAAYPVVMLHDRWIIDATAQTEFAQSGARFRPRFVSNSLEFMRAVILDGLGIGFFTPVGFQNEVARGDLVHVPLSEPGLGNSAIGVVVPRHRKPSAPVRMVLTETCRRLPELTQILPT